MGTLEFGRGQRLAAAVLLAAMLAGAASGSAVAASASDGNRFSRLMETEIAAPSSNPEMAQRQALGCTLVGLGVTGIAVASGALTVGPAASGLIPVGAAIGGIITYFGAGCTIGAFLAGLFPVYPSPATGIGG
ncbi:hypothetical protein [Azospirillum sp. sgz301742]